MTQSGGESKSGVAYVSPKFEVPTVVGAVASTLKPTIT
jgi:hypothetical protein